MADFNDLILSAHSLLPSSLQYHGFREQHPWNGDHGEEDAKPLDVDLRKEGKREGGKEER